MIYSLNNREDKLHEKVYDLMTLIRSNSLINAIIFDESRGSYAIKPKKDVHIKYLKKKYAENGDLQHFKGIKFKCERRWYGKFKKNSENNDKEPSSLKRGTKVHDQLRKFYSTKDLDPNKLDDLTKCIIYSLKKEEKDVVVCELPCIMPGCYATQADMIVFDKKTETFELIEIKTGKLQGSPEDLSKTEYFKLPLDNIELNEISKAEMQMIYTYMALKKTIPLLKISKCTVVNAYIKNKKAYCEGLGNSVWFKTAFSSKETQKCLIKDLKIKKSI